MQKTFTIPFYILLLLTAIISCQKDGRPLAHPSIAQAKAYFETHLQHQHQPSPQASRRQKTAKTPLWEQAYTTQLSIGTGIIVPLHYHSPLYTPLGKNKQPVSIDSLSYLLLYQSPKGTYQAEVITRLPEASYWDSKQRGPYIGHILVESWAGKPIKTIPYQRRPKVSPSTNAYYAEQFCWDQVWTITVTAEGETHTYRETETFCITIQQGGGGGGGSDNGGGGGQSPSGNDYQEDPRHPRGGGGQRSPEQPVQGNILRNQVQNYCLNRLVSQVVRSNADDMISNIISNLDEDVYVQISVIDAPETTNLKAAETDLIKVPNSNIIAGTITLSTNVLANSTKEYAVSVLVHEIIHSYLKYIGKNNKLQALEHQKMATDYIAPMVNYLTRAFGLSLRDATVLCWIGVNDSSSSI